MKSFISYSSTDRALARRVAEILRTKGVSVWLDEGELGPGDALGPKLASAIHDIDMFVVILTADAVASNWVNHELGIALTRMVEENVQLVPLRFDETEIPASLRGLIWGDGRSEQGLISALNLALKAHGHELPMSRGTIERRFTSRASLDYAVRLLPSQDFRHDGRLGADEREYVFVGDYAEQAGRSLRQILSNLWIGDAFDPVQTSNLKWTAILFEVGEVNRRKLDLMPGTWKAVFRILTAKNRLNLFDATDEENAQLGAPPRDYYAGDQNYWYSRITSNERRQSGIGRGEALYPDTVLRTMLGLDFLCFDGSGRTSGDSRPVPSRVFLLKNSYMENLNYRSQDLGHIDEGIILN